MAEPHLHRGSRDHLLGTDPSPEAIAAWSLETLDWRGPAPTLVIHAMDDANVPVDNSLMLLSALRSSGVPCEAHLFQEGGHGFGVRLIAGRPAERWPALVMAWGRRQTWLTGLQVPG